MTEKWSEADAKKIQRIVNEALPCPFCGERLIVHDDHHGQWVAHRREPGPCEASTSQLHDLSDLQRWNTRALPEGHPLPEDQQ